MRFQARKRFSTTQRCWRSPRALKQWAEGLTLEGNFQQLVCNCERISEDLNMSLVWPQPFEPTVGALKTTTITVPYSEYSYSMRYLKRRLAITWPLILPLWPQGQHEHHQPVRLLLDRGLLPGCTSALNPALGFER